MSFRLAVICLTVTLLCLSCDKGIVFQEVADIPTGKWAFVDVQKFKVDITDTLNPHLMLVDLRNSTAYPYSNVWLFVTQINPDGTSKTDTIDCPLSLPDGRWLGKSAGDGLDNLIMFRKDYVFPDPGSYVFKVQHGMRSDTLEEVRSVGIRIQKGYR